MADIPTVQMTKDFYGWHSYCQVDTELRQHRERKQREQSISQYRNLIWVEKGELLALARIQEVLLSIQTAENFGWK